MRMTTNQTNGQSTALPGNPTAAPAEPDAHHLTEEDQSALAEFRTKQEVLRGLTLGRINGNHTGAHVFGPPGVSKTFTIHNTLRERKASWRHHQRITAKPLYLELEQHPGAIHIIDDCEQLFREKSALTLLRSALGGEPVKGRRERRVSYSVAGSRARVMEHYFFGAIVFTSNRPLADERPEVQSWRVPTRSGRGRKRASGWASWTAGGRGGVPGLVATAPVGETHHVNRYSCQLFAERCGTVAARNRPRQGQHRRGAGPRV
jgi:hypothetical protein